jgi:hypothetical protein
MKRIAAVLAAIILTVNVAPAFAAPSLQAVGAKILADINVHGKPTKN